MYKRGQFYLIAALVIASILVGFVTLSNYSDRRTFVRVDNLKEELEIESGRVLDYGILNNDYQIENFTKNFSDYAGEDVDIYYIVGNETSLSAYKHNSSGQTLTTAINNGKVKVTIEGDDYEFNINPGENFYFIIIQKIGGEKYIATNQY